MNFEEIYHQHKGLVFNLALNYLQNQEDAQEVTQDVFVSVHQSLASFNQNAKTSTWIYRITINKSLDFIKAKNRKKRFGLISSLFFPDSAEVRFDKTSFDHPGVQLEQKEAIETIFRHINELPPNQKTALILSKIEQLSQAEIASVMNLNIKAVESLIQRGKANLSKKLNFNEGK